MRGSRAVALALCCLGTVARADWLSETQEKIQVFNPDDRVLALAAVDHHVLLWDVSRLRRALREIGLDWD